MIFDFEDLSDFVDEHKTGLAMASCVLTVAVSLITGGSENIKLMFARNAQDADLAEAQTRAERIFSEQGCSSQVLSATSRTANLANGDRAIDPMSITPANPDGVAFNGGCVTSPDGSVFVVQSDGTVDLVGTSPNVRKRLVQSGSVAKSKEMEAYAARIFQDQQSGPVTQPH